MTDYLGQVLENHLAEIQESLPKTTDSRRILHGRGKLHAGLEDINIDWFDPVLFISLYSESSHLNLLSILTDIFNRSMGRIETVVVQQRYLPDSPSMVVCGELQPPHYAVWHSLKFSIEFGHQQNVGFFLDMEAGRVWLEQNARGARVLNLFAYTCALSVVAAQAGADSIVNVDMSSRALSRGRDNHKINDLANTPVTYLCENILKSWGRIRKKGPFDVIIFDPPSYQKGSFIAKRDYAKLIKRIPELSADNCRILTCLNAPELDGDFIPSLFNTNLPDAGLCEKLPMHKDFADINESKALKLYCYNYSKL